LQIVARETARFANDAEPQAAQMSLEVSMESRNVEIMVPMEDGFTTSMHDFSLVRLLRSSAWWIVLK
jgi:hypothetical protein